MRRLGLILFLLCSTAQAQEWGPSHEWIYQTHNWRFANEGDFLSQKRTREYVNSLTKYCAKFCVDYNMALSQFTWESGWVNKIGDKHLNFDRWAYGLCKIQIRTAKERAKQIGYTGVIDGRELLTNTDLNIMLGVAQMSYISKVVEDGYDQIRAYNAGVTGALKYNRGWKHLCGVLKTLNEWEKFRGEDVTAP